MLHWQYASEFLWEQLGQVFFLVHLELDFTELELDLPLNCPIPVELFLALLLFS
jgi:hypothetical protein